MSQASLLSKSFGEIQSISRNKYTHERIRTHFSWFHKPLNLMACLNREHIQEYFDWIDRSEPSWCLNEVIPFQTKTLLFLDIDGADDHTFEEETKDHLEAQLYQLRKILEDEGFKNPEAILFSYDNPPTKNRFHVIYKNVVLIQDGILFKRLMTKFEEKTFMDIDWQCTKRGTLRLPGMYKPSTNDPGWDSTTRCYQPVFTLGSSHHLNPWAGEWKISMGSLFRGILGDEPTAINPLEPTPAVSEGVTEEEAAGRPTGLDFMKRLTPLQNLYNVRHNSPFSFGQYAEYPPVISPHLVDQIFGLYKERCSLNAAFELDSLKQYAVDVLNRHFAFINADSSIVWRLYDENHHVVARSINMNILKNFLSNVCIPYPYIDQETKKKSSKLLDLFGLWKSHPSRRTYINRVFNPFPDDHPEAALVDELNTYQGLKWSKQELMDAFANPIFRRRAGLFQKHLLNIIANENQDRFLYMLATFGVKVLRPWIKNKVLLILNGFEGTGKSIVAETFGKIFDSAFYICHNMNQVLERFNEELQDRLVVFIDEGFWGGHKSLAGRLKTLITQESMTMEGKYKTAKNVQNFLLFIIASNEPYIVPAGEHARRFAFYSTKAFIKKDNEVPYKKYFKKLYKINDDDFGGVKAWFAQFFDHNCFPSTLLDSFGSGIDVPYALLQDLESQRIRNANPVQLFWQIVLKRGYIIEPISDFFWPISYGISKLSIYNLTYGDYGRVLGRDFEQKDGNYQYTNPWLSWLSKNQIFDEYKTIYKSGVIGNSRRTIGSAEFWSFTQNIFINLKLDGNDTFTATVYPQNVYSSTNSYQQYNYVPYTGRMNPYYNQYVQDGATRSFSGMQLHIECVHLGRLETMRYEFVKYTGLPVNQQHQYSSELDDQPFPWIIEMKRINSNRSYLNYFDVQADRVVTPESSSSDDSFTGWAH